MKWAENILVRLIDYGFRFWFGWVTLSCKSTKEWFFWSVNTITSTFLNYLFSPFVFISKLVRMGSQYSKNDDASTGSYSCLGNNEMVVNEQKNRSFDLDFNGNFKPRSHIHFGTRKKIKDSDVIAISWDLAERKIDGSQLKGLEKGSKVFWVKANIAEGGFIKWVGRIKGILFAGLQMNNKVSVTLEGYSGKSLFTCKTRRGRALVLLSQVVPEKEFLYREETKSRNVAAVDFQAPTDICSQDLPTPKSTTSIDRKSTSSSGADNAYSQYKQLKPQSWDVGDRIYFPAKKCYANILAQGWNSNNQEFIIEYDERIGDPNLMPTRNVWFKEGHGRVLSMRKLVANAFIVEPSLNPSLCSSDARHRYSSPPECNNNQPTEPFSSAVTTVFINPQTLPPSRKRHSEINFVSENVMKRRAYSSLEYPPEIPNENLNEASSTSLYSLPRNFSVAEETERDPHYKFWGEYSSQDLMQAKPETPLVHNNCGSQGRRSNYQGDFTENQPNNFLKNTSLKKQSCYWGESHIACASAQRGILKPWDNIEQEPKKLPQKSFKCSAAKQPQNSPKETFNNSSYISEKKNLDRRNSNQVKNSDRNMEMVVNRRMPGGFHYIFLLYCTSFSTMHFADELVTLLLFV
ncbi:unnamed protein product [Allacma fusca]|uniref:Uncharacterized protein n=1 Tax=Allacma fusca TaxID=39272 RepID=A0A8J2LD80_9HEXA|nr:unnamed protein product [Allacma fusca]